MPHSAYCTSVHTCTRDIPFGVSWNCRTGKGGNELIHDCVGLSDDCLPELRLLQVLFTHGQKRLSSCSECGSAKLAITERRVWAGTRASLPVRGSRGFASFCSFLLLSTVLGAALLDLLLSALPAAVSQAFVVTELRLLTDSREVQSFSELVAFFCQSCLFYLLMNPRDYCPSVQARVLCSV